MHLRIFWVREILEVNKTLARNYSINEILLKYFQMHFCSEILFKKKEYKILKR